MALSETDSRGRKSLWRDWGKPLIFLIAAAITVVGVFLFRESLADAALREAGRVRQWSGSHPLEAAAVCIAIFAIGNGFSVPPLIVAGVVSGWLFGFWEGLVVTVIGTGAAAMVAFFVSRYLLRGAIVDRWPDLVQKADRMAARDGVYYVLSLRLLHVFPGWLVNLVGGCTAMRVSTFWLATQLGLLPSTILYVYAGNGLKSLAEFKHQGVWSVLTPTRLAIFFVLALLPLLLRAVIRSRQRHAG